MDFRDARTPDGPVLTSLRYIRAVAHRAPSTSDQSIVVGAVGFGGAVFRVVAARGSADFGSATYVIPKDICWGSSF